MLLGEGRDGMQQGLEYAATLDIPFVFSSNGDGFVFHDRTGAGGATESNLALDAFPSPDDLWARYAAWKGLTPETEKIVLQDYFDDGGGNLPPEGLPLRPVPNRRAIPSSAA